MSHLSLTINLSDSFVKYLNTCEKETFFKREVVTRAAYLGSIPFFCVTAAIDLILSVGAVIGATLTLGFCKPLVERAMIHLDGFQRILPLFLTSLACAVNPNTSFNALEFSMAREAEPSILKSDLYDDPRASEGAGIVIPALGIFGVACASLSICTAGRFHKLNEYAIEGLALGNPLEILTFPLLLPALIPRLILESFTLNRPPRRE